MYKKIDCKSELTHVEVYLGDPFRQGPFAAAQSTYRKIRLWFFFFFFFGTTTAVGQGLPVPTSKVSLAFSDLLLP